MKDILINGIREGNHYLIVRIFFSLDIRNKDINGLNVLSMAYGFS